MRNAVLSSRQSGVDIRRRRGCILPQRISLPVVDVSGRFLKGTIAETAYQVERLCSSLADKRSSNSWDALRGGDVPILGVYEEFRHDDFSSMRMWYESNE
jgi:hypothetical protein